MRIMFTAILFLSIQVFTLASRQEKTPAKEAIKKDAKEVAAGSKQVWHGVKSGGRTFGHKTRDVARTIGKGAKRTAREIKQEVKK